MNPSEFFPLLDATLNRTLVHTPAVLPVMTSTSAGMMWNIGNRSRNDSASVGEQQQPASFSSSSQLIGDERGQVIMQVMMYYVSPGVAMLGITGNTFSILILLRHGLHKCSNILLFSLAVADIIFLVSYNSPAKVLYEVTGWGRFLFSEPVSYLLFALFLVTQVLDFTACLVGLSLPMLITFERLMAVFFPLHFTRIVTPFRTWLAVAVVCVFYFSYYLYTCLWYGLDFEFDVSLNVSVGVIKRTARFQQDLHAMPILDEIYISPRVQPTFTFVGCVLIIVKVRMITLKRREMAKSTEVKNSLLRTTKMLMAVCVVYLFTCACLNIPTYLDNDLFSHVITDDGGSNMAVIMYQVLNVIASVNSSCNFIVYVTFNKNFRDSYVEILRLCCRRRKRV